MTRPKWWTDAATVVISKAKKKMKIKDDSPDAAGLEPTESGIRLLRGKAHAAGGTGEFYLLAEDCRKLLEWQE